MITLKIPEDLKLAIQHTAEKKFMSMSGYIKAACEKALREDGVEWRESKKPAKKKDSA